MSIYLSILCCYSFLPSYQHLSMFLPFLHINIKQAILNASIDGGHLGSLASYLVVSLEAIYIECNGA